MKSFIEKSNILFYQKNLRKELNTHLDLIKTKELKEYNELYEVVKNDSCFFEKLYESYNKTSKGEFFTPATVRDFAHFVLGNVSDKTVIDYACGTGSLIRNLKAKSVSGVELMAQSSEIARSLGLNVITGSAFDHVDNYDIALINPPFGLKQHTEVDFITHALKYCQRVVAILPLGVLFADKFKSFRKEHTKHLDSVIVLPSKTFYQTNIPVCIIDIDLSKEVDSVKMINASDFYNVEGKYNTVDKMAYDLFNNASKYRTINRDFTDRVDLETIKENDFNWSVSRYCYSENNNSPELYSNLKNRINSASKSLEESSEDLDTLYYIADRDLCAWVGEIEEIIFDKEMLVDIFYLVTKSNKNNISRKDVELYFSNLILSENLQEKKMSCETYNLLKALSA